MNCWLCGLEQPSIIAGKFSYVYPASFLIISHYSPRCGVQVDLTFQLGMIIRQNNYVHKQEQNGMAAHVINDALTILQFTIATYFDNDLPGQPRVRIPHRGTSWLNVALLACHISTEWDHLIVF